MNKKLKIITIIFVLVAIISTASYCSAPYDTQTARIISVKDTISASGYILKSESPVKISGKFFEPGIKDGTRVSKGNPIGVSITGDINQDLAKELASVTDRINEIKQSGSIADLYSSDEARIYTAMHTLTADIRQNVLEGNFSSATEHTTQLEILIEKKDSVENGSAADELLVSLEEEKYNLEQKIGGMRQEVDAPSSGYFYSSLDGMETELNEDELRNIKNTDIKGFETTLKEYTLPEGYAGKITDTYVWYMAASVQSEEAQRLKAGNTVTISVDDSIYVEATVLAVNSDDTDKSAVILKCDKNIPGIFEKRTARFEICLAEHTGLYIPSAAIRVKDDITGVYVMDENNAVTFKCVNILMESQDYMIAQKDYVPPQDCPFEALKTYDNILVNPEVSNAD